jgi:hypothetical protein
VASVEPGRSVLLQHCFGVARDVLVEGTGPPRLNLVLNIVLKVVSAKSVFAALSCASFALSATWLMLVASDFCPKSTVVFGVSATQAARNIDMATPSGELL